MIPTKRAEQQIVSTMDEPAIRMSIDPDSLDHIMAVLTDLYSDEELAVIREYSTNAWDSHIAAQKTGTPIEVWTPGDYAPVFRVIDHGLGLSEREIIDVYSRYGLSTKVETNDQVGYLGLGSKSALAYASQFTVIGTKDGRRTTAIFSRDEENVGSFTVVAREPAATHENGVEVIVPARKNNQFEAKARKFFQFWPAGSVKLNGELLEPIKITRVTSGHGVRKTDQYREDRHVLVMGNVAYPIKLDHFNPQLAFGTGAVIAVPIGSVHLTPNREALNYTTKTRRVLTEAAENLEKQLVAAMQREVEVMPTKSAALLKAAELRMVTPNARRKEFTWRGEVVPMMIAAEPGEQLVVAKGKQEKDWYSGRLTKIGKHDKELQIGAHALADAIWVYGFRRHFNHVVKKKLWHWCDLEKRPYPEYFICSPSKPRSPWIDPKILVPWGPIDQLKLPTLKKAPGAPTARSNKTYYDAVVDGRWVHRQASDLIRLEHPIFYAWSKYQASADGSYLFKLLGPCTVVHLTQSRLAKFKRLFPQATETRKAIHELHQTWWDSLTVEERLAVQLLDAPYHMRQADVQRTGDLELDRVARVGARVKAFQLQRSRSDLHLNHLNSQRGQLSRFRPPEINLTNILNKYPLLHSSHGDKEHRRLYIRAVNEALQAKER